MGRPCRKKISLNSTLFLLAEVPTEFMYKLHDTKVAPNADATFKCETSFDDVKVQWLINGKPVPDDTKYEVLTDGGVHTLIIKNVNPDESCEVTVYIGDESSTAKLIVSGELIIHSIIFNVTVDPHNCM